MDREAYSNKILVLGVDGLDPRLTCKYVREGKMPNTKQFIDQGAQRKDLVMLGGHPTVTPPMWTTLATGCYANVHGITGFYRQDPENLDGLLYNIDSRLCKAEQIWNVLAEAGLKTLVWHWPGSAWPPSSDSENLYVVDGSAPGTVGAAAAAVDKGFIMAASEKTEDVRFLPKANDDVIPPCSVKEIPEQTGQGVTISQMASSEMKVYLMDPGDGYGIEAGGINLVMDIGQSPLKAAKGWSVHVPPEAKEFTVLLSGGLIRRPALLLKGEAGLYDTVKIYKNKSSKEPFAVLPQGVLVKDIIDDGFKGDKKCICNRDMKLLDVGEAGQELRLYISGAVDTAVDYIWHPQRLYKEIVENVGYLPCNTSIFSHNSLYHQVMLDLWDHAADWQADAMQYVIDHENIDVVFSHFHAVDIQEHTFIRYCYDKGHNKNPEEVYDKWLEEVYVQTDNYLGKFLRYLAEGWSIFIVSDHAQVCPTYDAPMIGDFNGLNVRVMQELGYTVLKTDEDGHELREIDWDKTTAVANRANNIYINLKGRNQTGIVDLKDKYELEEQIMTDLYSYKHPKSGKRVIALALRNKDAVLLGYGGPECGDICYFIAEGYNYDHADSLSTTYGEKDTSVSPIFIAAGKGLKKSCTTERMIREVDLAPTIAVLCGVRMPRQCEGAPVYQILEQY